MLILANLIGIVILALGVLFLVLPGTMTKMISFWNQGKRYYWVGILRILFGAILLVAAPQANAVGVVVFLAVLFIASGVIIFALGAEKMSSYFAWCEGLPSLVVRLLAVITFAFGNRTATA